MWQRNKVGNQREERWGLGHTRLQRTLQRMLTSGPTQEPEEVTEEVRLFRFGTKSVCGFRDGSCRPEGCGVGIFDRDPRATDRVARGQTCVQARSFW